MAPQKRIVEGLTVLLAQIGSYCALRESRSPTMDNNISRFLPVHRLSRAAAGDTDAGQPEDWTLTQFSVKAEKTEALASALSNALLSDGGWYCNFNSNDEVVVVFHGRAFRYPAGIERHGQKSSSTRGTWGCRSLNSIGPTDNDGRVGTAPRRGI
jgi:hypothetical protein